MQNGQWFLDGLPLGTIKLKNYDPHRFNLCINHFITNTSSL